MTVTTVNISFSGGLESIAMLQKAMMEGLHVNLIFQNLAGVLNNTLAELVKIQDTIKFFKNHPDKKKYKGKIKEVYYMMGLPHLNRPHSNYNYTTIGDFVSNSMSQQWGTIQNMMVFRQYCLTKGAYPTTWIGWVKTDAAEYDHSEYSFTEAEYKALLESPVLVGLLGNSDRVARPFRAPLWEMTKKEVWDFVDPEVRGNVVLNGSASFNSTAGIITHWAYENKQAEYESFGLPYEKEVVIDINDIDPDLAFFIRRLINHVRPSDLGLPKEASKLISTVLSQKLVAPNCWVDSTEIRNVRGMVMDEIEELYNASHRFTWPVPVPTVEIFADVGEGAERVELLGDS